MSGRAAMMTVTVGRLSFTVEEAKVLPIKSNAEPAGARWSNARPDGLKPAQYD